MADTRPIGFFDSGVGGLTVLRDAQLRLPGESTIYLGDSARHPYGTRSDEEVVHFASELAEALIHEGVKAIVIACNTATAVALPALRTRYPETPFIGVIRPGAAAAALSTRNGRIGVLATAATVRSGAYFTAIKDENPALHIVQVAASELVPLIEQGEHGSAALRSAVAQALLPLTSIDPAQRVDTLLLGCTHFPFAREAFASCFGDTVAIVDSATAAAGTLREVLAVNQLEAPGSSRGTAADAGHAGHTAPEHVAVTPTHRLLTTGDTAQFRQLAVSLFGSERAVETIEQYKVPARG